MTSRKELDREIAEKFKDRIIRDVSDRRVLVSQGRKPHMLSEDIERLAEGLMSASGMYDSSLLTPHYERAKANSQGSFFDPALFAFKPEGWIACAAEAVAVDFLNTPEGAKFQDFRQHFRDGARVVASQMMVTAERGTQPSFTMNFGNTHDGRPVISSCPVPGPSRKMFLTFYDVMKADIPDPDGHLARVVTEMKSQVRK